jgi:nucleoside-diphosphate-sugar epimerase
LSCLEKGHQVQVLGQENTPAEVRNSRSLKEHGAGLILGSVTERALLDSSFEGIEVVFHLAATQHEMNVPDQRFWDVNVGGTRNVMEAACSAGVRRVVHGSTIGVYGSINGRIDENSACRPDNIYGVTKLEGEKLALSYQGRAEVAAIRIPEVYGPGDQRLLKLFRAVRKSRFMTIGSGKNLHHLIYVGDLIDVCMLAAGHPAAPGEVFLVAGERPFSTNEMVSTIANELKVRAPRLHLPLFPFRLLAAVLEKTLRPLGIQPPLHERRLDFFRKSFTLSWEKAHRMLGFKPGTDLSVGVRRTAAWYSELGYL